MCTLRANTNLIVVIVDSLSVCDHVSRVYGSFDCDSISLLTWITLDPIAIDGVD